MLYNNNRKGNKKIIFGYCFSVCTHIRVVMVYLFFLLSLTTVSVSINGYITLSGMSLLY